MDEVSPLVGKAVWASAWTHDHWSRISLGTWPEAGHSQARRNSVSLQGVGGRWEALGLGRCWLLPHTAFCLRQTAWQDGAMELSQVQKTAGETGLVRG